MSKVKKANKYWMAGFPPLAPFKPIPPEKNIVTDAGVEIKRVYLENVENEKVPLNTILPECVNIADVDVTYEQVDRFGDENNCLIFTTRGESTVPNPHYAQDIESYNKSIEKWKLDKEKHKEELKLFKEWEKKEKEARLQARIEKAEKLLKQHGKL